MSYFIGNDVHDDEFENVPMTEEEQDGLREFLMNLASVESSEVKRHAIFNAALDNAEYDDDAQF